MALTELKKKRDLYLNIIREWRFLKQKASTTELFELQVDKWRTGLKMLS